MGSNTGTFVLRRQGTGENIALDGLSNQLSEHSGEMVQVSGTMSQSAGKDVLMVSAIKKVSGSCDNKPGLGASPSETSKPGSSSTR